MSSRTRRSLSAGYVVSTAQGHHRAPVDRNIHVGVDSVVLRVDYDSAPFDRQVHFAAQSLRRERKTREKERREFASLTRRRLSLSLPLFLSLLTLLQPGFVRPDFPAELFQLFLVREERAGTIAVFKHTFVFANLDEERARKAFL